MFRILQHFCALEIGVAVTSGRQLEMTIEQSAGCFKNVKHCGCTHEKYGLKMLIEDFTISESKDKEAVLKS